MSGATARIAGKDFHQVADLLALIQGSFAYMRGIVDPPSSAERLTEASLTAKIRAEILIVAEANGQLIGCAFGDPRGDHLYLGKIAVASAAQGMGAGRAMLGVAIEHARALRLPELRLETRVELTNNHRTFEAWGFKRVAESSHSGFVRPTSYTYSRPV